MMPNLDIPARPIPVYDPPMEPLNIIYQDDAVMVVSKPSGLLSVPGTKPGTDDNLHTRAMAVHPGAQIVHRLDWDTSGLMVFALTLEATRKLGAQFEKRRVEKHYVARVWGRVAQDQGVIDLPLRCDWPNRPKQMICHERGREAITHWQVMARGVNSTDLLMKPKTGRSHQLRVHCLSMGHPILADRLYAHEAAYQAHSRMCLHASKLAFNHPTTGDLLTFSDPALF